jgi:hypothetical protein
MKTYSIHDASLNLNRCPHCAVASPLLSLVHRFDFADAGRNYYSWNVYCCSRCGVPVVGGCPIEQTIITHLFPVAQSISEDVPEKAAAFLSQAMESLHAPSGAVMLCASSVDAMLKEKGYKKGNLYHRIDEASNSGLITAEMATWAHEIRLDANDERHADECAELPNTEDAQKCINFVRALADFMYVLPARVKRGRTIKK